MTEKRFAARGFYGQTGIKGWKIIVDSVDLNSEHHAAKTPKRWTHCPCHKSLHIISTCHGTAPAITVLSYVQVQYIYFMLGSSKHIYPPLRFSPDYAMTLHDMIALNMQIFSAEQHVSNYVSRVYRSV